MDNRRRNTATNQTKEPNNDTDHYMHDQFHVIYQKTPSRNQLNGSERMQINVFCMLTNTRELPPLLIPIYKQQDKYFLIPHSLLDVDLGEACIFSQTRIIKQTTKKARKINETTGDITNIPIEQSLLVFGDLRIPKASIIDLDNLTLMSQANLQIVVYSPTHDPIPHIQFIIHRSHEIQLASTWFYR